MLYGAHDVRYVDREAPTIVEPTDAIIRLSATCVCGSDLWPYRGIDAPNGPTPMGHEYCGIVEEVGRDVKEVKRGQFVVGSFFASDNTCTICKAGRRPTAPDWVVWCGCRRFPSTAASRERRWDSPPIRTM